MTDRNAVDPLAATHTPDATAVAPAALGTTRSVGRFAVLRKLGSGGMGTVYAAYDEQLDRRVALKLLHAGPADGQRQQRVLREAQAMARVSHPAVVQVFDAGTIGDQVFIAMEYVEGSTLADWQEQGRPWQEVMRRYCQAGGGLLAAHRAGLVHRDFKPDNVLLDHEGRPRVADFGLARLPDRAVPPGADALRSGAAPPSSPGALRSPLTEAGAICGTPQYMSPEQFRGGILDGRSDQFSFCVALYEALFDRLPFRGETLAERAAQVLAGRPLPPPDGAPVPGGVWSALRRGLATEPEGRFPSMAGLLQALVAGAEQESPPAQAVRRRGALAGMLAIAVMGTIMAPLMLRRTASVKELLLVPGAAMLGAIALFLRRSLLENPLHRAALVTGVLFMTALCAVRLAALLVQVQMEVYLPIDLMVTAVLWTVMIRRLFPRGWSLGVLAALAAIAGAFLPEHIQRIAMVPYLWAPIYFLYLWDRAARAPASSLDRPGGDLGGGRSGSGHGP